MMEEGGEGRMGDLAMRVFGGDAADADIVSLGGGKGVPLVRL